MSFNLFGREWQKDGDILRCGEGSVNLSTQRGCATPTSSHYSIRSKKGLLALEIEVRATQDDEDAVLIWFNNKFPDYQVEYGDKAVVISRKNDEYGLSLTFSASGKTLSSALIDFAQRM